MTANTSLSIDQICRTCMSSSPAMLPLFSPSNPLHDPSSPSGMLSSFTDIQAKPSDGLPQQICINCLREINQAVSFKHKCERSESTLQSYLKLLQPNHDQSGVLDILDNESARLDDVPLPPQVSHLEEVFPDESKCNEFPELREIEQYLDGHDPNLESHNLDGCGKSAVTCLKNAECDPFEELHDDQAHGGDTEMDLANEPITEELMNVSVDLELLDVDSQISGTLYSSLKPSIHLEIERDDDDNSTNGETETDQTCAKCSAQFACVKSLQIHQKSNRCTIKSFECYVCNRYFVHKKNLTIHLRKHLRSEYVCSLCPKEFTRKDELTLHMQNHGSNRKHTCPHCPKGFNMLSSLKDHLRTHNGERPYLCMICGKGFSQSTNLRQHVKRHTNTKPFSCSTCEFAFVTKGELNTHMRTHSGDQPFVCDVCGAAFTTSSSLLKHGRIHTGERPYACEYCPMRFTVLATLKNHRRTHTGEKPFACEFCPRKFAQRSDYVSHQLSHSGVRHTCTTCRQEFIHKSSLKTHIKSHHRVES